MKTETLEEYLARGGVVRPWTEAPPDPAAPQRTWGQMQFAKRKKAVTKKNTAPITSSDEAPQPPNERSGSLDTVRT